MATLMFQCGQCGKPLAITPENLGKKVRCPHCRQVIKAPAAGTTPARLPAPSLPDSPNGPAADPAEFMFGAHAVISAESIFDPDQEDAGDALFAGPPPVLVEMPSEAPVPEPEMDSPAAPEPPASALNIEGDPAVSDLHPDDAPAMAAGPAGQLPVPLPWSEPAAAAGSDLHFTQTSNGPGSALVERPPGDPSAALQFTGIAAAQGPFQSPSNLEGAAHPDSGIGQENAFVGTEGAVPAVRRPARGGMLMPTLLIFLIPYSIVATIAAVIFYLRPAEPSLEILPDPKPDPDAGGPSRRSKPPGRVRSDLQVPVWLRTNLGNTVVIGDLEVTPRRVEWHGPDLRLTLQMRNRSDDLEFNPVSNAFLEYARTAPPQGRSMPYTFLQAGSKPSAWIYGGTWQTFRNGRSFDRPLSPGETLTAQLTTDPRDRNPVESLKHFQGPLLWRVQLRRGLVSYKGADVSTTAVIGVELTGQSLNQSN